MTLPLPLPLPAAVRGFTPPKWVRPLVFVAACLPLAWIATALASDAMRGTRFLGSNPIKEAEHMLGEWTLRFLMLALFVTPLRQLIGWNWLQRYRRMLGLFAFAYVCVHLSTWAVLDVELDWGDIVKDLTKRWYIMIGMAGFLLMLPLAVTSTAAMVKRLGKRWVTLHKLIYVIVVLGTIHFFMAVKKDIGDPIIYALIFAALFGWRIYMVVRRRRGAVSAAASPPRSAR